MTASSAVPPINTTACSDCSTAIRPVRMPVVGEVAAGRPAPHNLAPGTAMKIMTGAKVTSASNTTPAATTTHDQIVPAGSAHENSSTSPRA